MGGDAGEPGEAQTVKILTCAELRRWPRAAERSL